MTNLAMPQSLGGCCSLLLETAGLGIGRLEAPGSRGGQWLDADLLF